LALIEGFMPEAEWLDDGATLTYLHSCFSTRQQRVRVPETPMHLDAILADEELAGGLEPRLGRAYLRTLTVMGFPSQTWPGLLDDLNRLASPTAGRRARSASTRPTRRRCWRVSAGNGSRSASRSWRSSRR
jgi:type IV secretion system protein TrbE